MVDASNAGNGRRSLPSLRAGSRHGPLAGAPSTERPRSSAGSHSWSWPLCRQRGRPEQDLRRRSVQRRVEPCRTGAGRRRAGPNEELVLVQSKKLTISDPEFRTAIEQTRGRLHGPRTSRTSNRRSQAMAGVPRDTALIEFEITGNALEAADRLDPSPRGRRGPGHNNQPDASSSSERQLQQGAERDFHERPGKGRDAVATALRC